MLNWIINIAAGIFHVTNPELRKLEAALPATKKLVDLFNTKKDLITKGQDIEKQVLKIYNDNQPLIHEITQMNQELQPIITEAMEEWKTVGPALSLLIDILERNKKKGINYQESASGLKMTLEHHSKF